MLSSEIPEGVFWARITGSSSIADDGATARATRWGPGVVLFFGPGVINRGFRTDAESVRGTRLRALGYDTSAPINTYRTSVLGRWQLADQPADAQPMTMLPGFTDPAISSVAEPDFVWVTVSGTLATYTGATGPVRMIRRAGRYNDILVAPIAEMPQAHRITDTENAVYQAARLLIPDGDLTHWVVGAGRHGGDVRVVSEPTPVPTRPEDLKVGDWFTWGSQVAWHRVASVDGSSIHTDAQHYSGTTLTARGSQSFVGVSDNFCADPASYPATLTTWIANQEPVAAPPSTEPAEPVSVHAADIATIGRILIAEAESRSWCGEYDQIVGRINREISIPLPVRNAEYTITYTVPSPQQATVRQQFTAPPTQAQAQAYLPAGAVLVSVEPTPEF